jgi:hypothetical protein
VANDDVKIGLSADLSTAQRDGEAYMDAFLKGVKSRTSANPFTPMTLGNGMQTTGGPSTQDPIAAVLSKILSTLQMGFAQGLPGAPGAAGAGAAPPGGAAKPAYAPYTPPAGRFGSNEDGTIDWKRIGGAVNRTPMQQIANTYQGGGYQTDVAGLASNVAGNIPIFGPALKQFGEMITGTLKQRDGALEQSLDMFRSGGKQAWGNFRNMMTGGPNDTGQAANHRMMYWSGLSHGEVGSLMKQQNSYGRTGGAMEGLAGLQGFYGLGSQGASYMTSLVHGGDFVGRKDTAKGQDVEKRAFAEVMAVAIGTQLDRGRWGEAFTAMTRAASSVTTGDVDRHALLARQQFIGQMGDRFKGDTASAQTMNNVMSGLQGGQGGGVANIFALQTAFQQGAGSYGEASMMVARGQAKGGIDLKLQLQRFAKMPLVADYLNSPIDSSKALGDASLYLSMMLPGYKRSDIEALLRGMRKEGGGARFPEPISVDTTRVMEAQLSMNGPGGQRLPERESDLIRSQIDKGDMWNENAIGPTRVSDLGRSVENQDEADYRVSGLDAAQPSNQGARLREVGTNNYNGSIEQRGASSSGDMTSPDFMKKYTRAGGRFGATGADRKNPHGGVDLELGSQASVYSPVDGTVRASRIGTGQEVGFGVTIVADDTGYEHGVFHLDPKTVGPGIKSGARVRKGQFLGKLFKGKAFTSGVPNHTHYQVKDKDGQVMDPGKVQDMSDLQKASPDQPVMTPAAAPQNGAPTTQGPVMSPTASAGGGGVDVNVYVYDGRISVQRVAANRRQHGAPGTLGGKKRIG